MARSVWTGEFLKAQKKSVHKCWPVGWVMKQVLKVNTRKLSLQADGSQCRDDGAVTN